jgi:hypothetical protein
MDAFSFVRAFFLSGYLMRRYIYVSSMWRYVVLFVVIKEEILVCFGRKLVSGLVFIDNSLVVLNER